MAYNCVEIDAPPAAVFAVLVDPRTYPRWLIGAHEIRSIDADWPQPGSHFHHRVGVGPFTIPDSSKVLELTPGERLRLAVRARPLISAVATFTIIGDERHTLVTLEEEPAQRLVGNLVRPVMDPITHVRNQRSLRRLVALVEGGSGAKGPVAPAAGKLPDARHHRVRA